jgi:hypothetical protein
MIGPALNQPSGSGRASAGSQMGMNFYTKVLSRFAASSGLRLTVQFDVRGDEKISPQKNEETKVAFVRTGTAFVIRTGSRESLSM